MADLTVDQIWIPSSAATVRPVSELCQNPSWLNLLGLSAEREQILHIVEKAHFSIELMEAVGPRHTLRNQQVASSIPAGGSIEQPLSVFFLLEQFVANQGGTRGLFSS